MKALAGKTLSASAAGLLPSAKAIHVLPSLPYEVGALEPHLDARTLYLHHDLHHAAYVKKLNEAIAGGPATLRDKSASWLLRNPGAVPRSMAAAVRDNAGGHVNHSLYWRAMSPAGGGAPDGELAEAIDEAFGSLVKFRHRFEEAGVALFGSGWVWLVQPERGAGGLRVLTTSGHDNPMSQGFRPLLVNDVWEHAYYLRHENRRIDYLKGWWALADWEEAGRRHARPLKPIEPAASVR